MSLAWEEREKAEMDRFEYKEIPLTQGKVARVDASDYSYLSQWKWCAARHVCTYYAVRSIRENGKKRSISMHRMLMGAPGNLQVDHKDGDGLNNRRDNLRLATAAQNCRNRRVSCVNTSGVKGVSWKASKRKWVAQINVGPKQVTLGQFSTVEEARAAYITAARELYGEFARFS